MEITTIFLILISLLLLLLFVKLIKTTVKLAIFLIIILLLSSLFITYLEKNNIIEPRDQPTTQAIKSFFQEKIKEKSDSSIPNLSKVYKHINSTTFNQGDN